MTILILGLVIFLGTHSIRIVANEWRNVQVARHGEMTWKGGYALASLLGFGLVIWGFGMARMSPQVLWQPPAGMSHLGALLMLASFVLLAATYVPRNRIKAAVHHPMLLATVVWAVAHLLTNGTLADMILFGSFLLWSVLALRASHQRDRAAGTVYPAGTLSATLTTVVAGGILWGLFAFLLHGLLIGVHPFA
jgi:uncharacterized membrane protein